MWSYMSFWSLLLYVFVLHWFLSFNRSYDVFSPVVIHNLTNVLNLCKQYFSLREHFSVLRPNSVYVSGLSFKYATQHGLHLNRLSICKWPCKLWHHRRKQSKHYSDTEIQWWKWSWVQLFTSFRKHLQCMLLHQSASVMFSFQGDIIYVKMLLCLL